MKEATPIPGMPDEARTKEIFEALGYFNYLTFAPPNIYPMAAPAFQKAERAERPAYGGGPLGIYVHIPFCNYACQFCFYAKRIGETRDSMVRYVDALEKELAWIPAGTPLSQLYVGGGTPTALPAELLDRTLTLIFRNVTPGTATHTVECSPDSITDEHIRVLVKHGIGRMSMGIQSTQDRVLDEIRRKHSGEAALETCARLVSQGLMVNVDLIYGLPGQTEAHFRHDLEVVAASGVHSVTAYDLRVNDRTPIAKSIAEDERLGPARLVRWRAFVRQAAAELGYRQTRCHTFVRSVGDDAGSRRAAAFRDITGRGNQFGAGLSARSRLNGTVYRNNADLNKYVECIEQGMSPVQEVFPLDETALRIRYIALSLGEGEHLDRADYLRTFGRSFDEDFAEPLRRTRDAGLVADGATIALTDTGRLVYDKVLLAFYPEQVKQWLKEREQSAVAKGRLLPAAQS